MRQFPIWTRNEQRKRGGCEKRSGNSCPVVTGSDRVCFMEQLESRILLDIAPVGPTLLANEPTEKGWGGDLNRPAVAMDADGDFLVVWERGYAHGVLGRFFDSTGRASDPVITLITPSSGYGGVGSAPAVAMDTDGDFVIAWEHYDAYYGDHGIAIQLFRSDGTPSTPELLVTNAGRPITPGVAMDADGDFLVVWGDYYATSGVFGQVFYTDGTTSPTMHLVEPGTGWETRSPAVAMDDDGDFVLAWEYYDTYSSQQLIQGGRFEDYGIPVGSQFLIAPYDPEAIPSQPSVGMDADGDFVVTWLEHPEQYDPFYGPWFVQAQRFDEGAVPVGEQFTAVHSGTWLDSQGVAMDADGDFVITWDQYNWNGVHTVSGQRFAADGSPQRSKFCVTTGDSWCESSYSDPSVVIDSDGDFLVVWEGAQYERGIGVLGRFFDSSEAPLDPIFHFVTAGAYGRVRDPAVAMDNSGDFIIAWEQYDPYGMGEPQGIYAQRFESDGTPSGSAFRIADTTEGYADLDIAMDADGDFLVVWQMGQYGEGGIWGRRFNAADEAQGPAMRLVQSLNNPSGTGPMHPSVAMDADGDFVLAWCSYFYGAQVLAQRFDSDGTPESLPAVVSTSAFPWDPDVIVDINGNSFVVWQSGYAGQGGIWGSRLDAANNQIGLVSQYVPASGRIETSNPVVAMDNDGDFVIIWEDEFQDSYARKIVGQRFTGDDVPRGARFLVSPAPAEHEWGWRSSRGEYPAVAMDGDGDFLVVWQSGDYGDNGILGRFFDASGRTQGPTLQLVSPATYTNHPSVAMDSDGDFVITWEEYDWYVGFHTVLAQRFAPDGSPFGSQLVIATGTMEAYPDNPTVGMAPGGGFVVAWTRLGYDTDNGIFARFFDGTGGSPSPEIQLVSPAYGQEVGEPAVAMYDDGDLVVAWKAYDDYSLELLAQRFDSQGNPVGEQLLIANGTIPTSSYVPTGPGGDHGYVAMTGLYVTMAITSGSALYHPAVAMDGEGDFVICWDEHHEYTGRTHILGRFFSAEGVEQLLPKQLVGQFFGAMGPGIASDALGNLVLSCAWECLGGEAGIAVQRFETFLRGDLNGDGFVGQTDIDILFSSWGAEVALGDPADPSGDGFVGQTDLDILLQDWGKGVLPGTTSSAQTSESASQVYSDQQNLLPPAGSTSDLWGDTSPSFSRARANPNDFRGAPHRGETDIQRAAGALQALELQIGLAAVDPTSSSLPPMPAKMPPVSQGYKGIARLLSDVSSELDEDILDVLSLSKLKALTIHT